MVAMKVPERKVRGNGGADNLFSRFAPLQAYRDLGNVAPDKLKEFGLDDAGKRIRVFARGTEQSFTIAPPPPGASDAYLQDEASGRVFVVDNEILRNFKGAKANLVERAFHKFREFDVERLEIKVGDSQARFRVQRRVSGRGIELFFQGRDQKDASATTWHERVWDLFPSDVLGENETPPSGEPDIGVRVNYVSRGRQIGWLEIGLGRQQGWSAPLHEQSSVPVG